MDALNLKLLDVDKFIKERGCLEVSSPFLHAPTSNSFDQNGLFSEQIFGEVASDMRLVKFGWMRLNCRVFHPVIFQNLQTLKRFYVEIMAGRSYAKWDPEINDFVHASEDEEGADTGFTFFLNWYPKIDFKTNKSLRRNNRVNVIVNNSKIALIDKMIVMPAGIRDIKETEGRLEKDSINGLYLSLMTSAKAMPPSGDTDPIYDVIHYSVQRKVMEIYEYVSRLVKGGGGFLEGKLGHRAVVGGTRNVITATNLEADDPTDPQFHKCDETKVPLYQAAKGYASLVVYHLRSMFYSSVVNQDSDNVALIDTDDYSLKYVPIDPKDKDTLITEEGIQKVIDRFRDPEYRFRSVVARSGGKPYYLYLVYDDGKEIYIFRQLQEFITDYGDKFDKSKLRPLTYAEMLYIATYFASRGKSGTITRYPVTDTGSIYVSKTHLMSTKPARVVKFVTNIASKEGVTLPEYPVINGSIVDVLTFHPSRRAGLSADYDGNCVTGDTTIQLRFTHAWLDTIKSLDYSVSGQNITDVVDAIVKNAIAYDNYLYVTTEIKNIPQPGEFMYDKNHAKVYDIPAGCEVLSFENEEAKWMPFEKVTVEDNCEYVRIKARNRFVNVSTNPSVAVFDHMTGALSKVTPKDAVGKYAPIIKKDLLTFGNYGTFTDGWLLGVLVSDGYVTEKYLGYTKLEDSLRNKVIDVLKTAIGNDLMFKEYTESPETGANKLAVSKSLHITDARAIQFGKDLDMYSDSTWNALTKRIPEKCLMTGTKEYLLGILCGLLDGDGTILVDKSDSICFRFSTSSKALLESIKFLGYRLGIGVSTSKTPPRNWSKESYVAMLRTNDVFRYINELSFVSERNIDMLAKFKADASKYAHGSLDTVAISREEAESLYLIDKRSGIENMWIRYRHAAKRYKLTPYLKYLDPESSLYKRIANNDIEWGVVSIVSEPEKATVYDLLVPGSKVFAVNNGLVIYDTVSWIPLYSAEANEECDAYYNSASCYSNPDGKSQVGLDDLVGITMHAMTADCKELH